MEHTVRLSQRERHALKAAALESFGPQARVRLFGSRLDASRRGGDIDLLVETTEPDAQRVSAALTRFMACVYRELGEQKLDVVLDYPGRRERPPILALAKAVGVDL